MTLLRQGDTGGFVLAIGSGRIAILGHDADGGELLLALRGSGDLVGELALASGTRTATVRAVDRCTAHAIAASSFQEFLGTHDLHDRYAEYLATKLSETVPYSVRQVHSTPLSRLSRLLWDLVSLDDGDQQNPRRVPLSQEALARALGLARSTVADQIAVLRRARVLGPGPRLVVTDPVGLARHADVTEM